MDEWLDSTGKRFSREQVCRILRLGERQLAAWERQGLVGPAMIEAATVEPAAAQPGRASPEQPEPAGHQTRSRRQQRLSRTVNSKGSYYTFSDIVTLRTLLKLRKSGVSPSRLRRAHAALRELLAGVEKPWSELQVDGNGKEVVVQFHGARLEPVSGQFILAYNAEANDKPRIHPFTRSGSPKGYTLEEKRAIAERFFLAGLRCEESGGPAEKAMKAYQRAIEMNPKAVGAYINLGTIYYNLGSLEAAESCYQSALSIDRGYALVHFNMGNVADERSDLPAARQCYEEAIRLDPAYPDPHYNLALIYEKLGLHGKARQQWLRYLKFDPQSQWASYARQQLARTPLRIIRSESSPQNTS